MRIGNCHRPQSSDSAGWPSLTNLTNDPNWDGYPAWSPDGSHFAFSTNNGVEFDLHVMSADGTGRRRMPEVDPDVRTANDCCPAWTP